MARRNSDKQAQEQIQEQPPEPSQDAAQPQTRQVGDERAEAPKREFQPVRGWTQRFEGPLKYRKFTDADLRVIAFKFNLPPNEKPPEEVLTLMKSNMKDKDGQATGLLYQSTRKHGPIWTIPNDIEGRTLADRIDFRLSELAQKMDETQAKSPAL
jgi:hypothetical protein